MQAEEIKKLVVLHLLVYRKINLDGKFEIWNATHERNLGDDPNHCVTASCGTGSTVAGAVVMKKHLKDVIIILIFVKINHVSH